MSRVEITKREIGVSISIVAVLLLIGILISGKMLESKTNKDAEYNKAARIDTQELFEYGMKTDVGNAFVYGTLEAVDPVTYPEIDGKYMYLEKVKEEYTMHTRTVTTTDSNGKTKTKTETYWTWDEVDREEQKCKEIKFCGLIFKSEKIKMPSTEHIDTVNRRGNTRHQYYGVSEKLQGTIYTRLEKNTIKNESQFYKDMGIEDTVKNLESNVGVIVFWIAWLLLISLCVGAFCYADNKWLK